MHTVILARQAMATRFEIVLHGEDAIRLRAAGEEALDEIERLESQLSLYRRTSEISQINARAAQEPLRVEPTLFRLLQRAKRLFEESRGTFDITVAPLMRCWGFMGGSGVMPAAEQIADSRSKVGARWMQLCERDFTVRFEREGMMLDLGAIGKGYALDRAADILKENGVQSALLHGGTSTVYAIGQPPEGSWKIAIDLPVTDLPTDSRPSNQGPISVATLRDEALSVSAPHGKFFKADGKMFGHVLDPRTGEPTQAALMAAVVLPSATDTDALSTALLTLGESGHDLLGQSHSNMRSLTVIRSPDGSLKIDNRGM